MAGVSTESLSKVEEVLEAHASLQPLNLASELSLWLMFSTTTAPCAVLSPILRVMQQHVRVSLTPSSTVRSLAGYGCAHQCGDSALV